MVDKNASNTSGGTFGEAKTCPNCGYCPHCGQAPRQSSPLPWWPYIPYQPYQPYPWQPTITYIGTGPTPPMYLAGSTAAPCGTST